MVKYLLFNALDKMYKMCYNKKKGVLVKIEKKFRALASPHIGRGETNKFLEKDEMILQLSEHMIKYHIYPRSRDRNHWAKEMKTWLSDISLELSRSTVAIEDDVKIRKLWHGADDLLRRIDRYSNKALRNVLRYGYKEERIDDQLEGNISEYGFQIEDYKIGKYIYFRIKYNDQEIASTEE